MSGEYIRQNAGNPFRGVWIEDLPEAERLKRFDRLKRQFVEIGKGADYVLVKKWRSVSEEYVDANLSLVVYLHVVRTNDGGRAGAIQDGHVGDLPPIAVLIFNLQPHHTGYIDGGDHKSMLVHIVESRQFPHLELASLVRLYFVEDKVGEKWMLPPYRFEAGRGFYLRPFLSDRQRDPVGSQASELHNYVVQRCPEIMNGISDNQWNVGWVRGNRSDLEIIVSRMRILLDMDFTEVRFEEGLDEFYQLADVAVCPLDFQARAIKLRE
jgi:hypothetical protein